MNNKWKEVWDKRTADTEQLKLDDLIKLDGFDTGAGKIDTSDWRILTNTIARKIGLKNGDSVYEVGCGAGAFLYSLRESFNLKVGGIDYADGLIAAAQNTMPDGDWKLDEAKNIPEYPKYDYVISHSVFHYFSTDYASMVFERMVKKARNGIAVLEIPDLATKKESEKMRRDILTEEEYKKKYEGLEHTYYSKDWFIQKAVEYGAECSVFGGCVPNYIQNDYRFGVILKLRN